MRVSYEMNSYTVPSYTCDVFEKARGKTLGAARLLGARIIGYYHYHHCHLRPRHTNTFLVHGH